MWPNILNYKFASESFTICTHTTSLSQDLTKEAGPMRSAFEAGGSEKEAGPLGRRPGPSQRLDAGSRVRDPGPASDTARSNEPDAKVTKTPGRKWS